MSRGRIDDRQLFRLLAEEGKTQQEAAAYFGVSQPAIALNLPAVGLQRAQRVADRGLDVMAQLVRINETVLRELTWAEQEAQKPEAPRRALQDTIIGLSAEVRKQLGLQLDVMRALYDVQEVAAFQKEVLDAVGRVSPETRTAILEGLAARRALRGATLPAPAGW